jgi:hypothetical protein
MDVSLSGFDVSLEEPLREVVKILAPHDAVVIV